MKKPLRVLTISKPYVAAAYREKLRIWAKDPNLEIGLIVPEAWGDQEYETSDKDDFWIRRLPIRLNGKNHFFSYKKLEATISEFKPDVINCEEEHYSFVTYQVFRVASKRKIKTLFYTWQNIFKRYPFPFSYIESKIFKQAVAGAAGNQEALDILRAKGFTKDIKLIPQMGVNTSDFYPDSDDKRDGLWLRSKLNLPSEAFIIVYMGRMVEEKGLMDLVNASELIPKGSDVYILFMGNGPYQAKIKNAVEDFDKIDTSRSKVI
jgi:glycosyltransferase involved in cell wall biosynthesis